MKINDYFFKSFIIIFICCVVILSLYYSVITIENAPIKAYQENNWMLYDNTNSLMIEVDFIESNYSEVSEAFNFLKVYFETKNISVIINHTSTNNIITTIPTLWDSHLKHGVIERMYHDNPDHIYFIISNSTVFSQNTAGVTSEKYGIIISLNLMQNYEYNTGIIMHEFGHSLGMGLHDDLDGQEVYSENGYMSKSPWTETEYNDTDWSDAFASNESFIEYGTSNRYKTRIWNKSSVKGEQGDSRTLISGHVALNNGTSVPTIIYDLNSIDDEVYGEVNNQGDFYIFVSPGNHTLTFAGFNNVGQIYYYTNITDTFTQYDTISNMVVVLDDPSLDSQGDRFLIYSIVLGLMAILVFTNVIMRKRKSKL